MRRAISRITWGFLALMSAVVNPQLTRAAEKPLVKPKEALPVWARGPYPLSVPPSAKTPLPVYQQLELLSRDGTKLIVHEWSSPRAPRHKPVVIFLHGIGMHGQAYAAIAAGFTAQELTLIAPDLRGHGRSGGKRGALANPQVLRSDLGEVIGLANRRHPKAPVVLAGESMGALLAADYAWRGERRLAGLALLAPAFKLNRSQLDFNELRKNLGKWLLEGIPLDTDARLAVSTRDTGFFKARQTDPLALHKVSPGYLLGLLSLQRQWPRAAAQLRLPLFMGVAGKDKVVDGAAIKAVFERTASAMKDKVWRQWDLAFHTLCWDPVTPQVIAELATWTLKCR